MKISGQQYSMMYGPTVGDKVRLADTDLIIEVEKDYTVYGDECKFGGGKTLRDGMGQSVNTTSATGDLDLVLTNALVVDYTGIFKADIGIKDGVIAGIGKAGNPDIMDGVTPGMVVGASTEALATEGMIVTVVLILTSTTSAHNKLILLYSAVSQQWQVAVLVLTTVQTLQHVLLVLGT